MDNNEHETTDEPDVDLGPLSIGDELEQLAADVFADEPEDEEQAPVSLASPDLVRLLEKVATHDPATATRVLGAILDNSDRGRSARGAEDKVHRPAPTDKYRWSAHTTPNLDRALSSAQGAMRNAQRNKKNTHLGTKYADLGSVIDACREACSEAGIAVYQFPWGEPGSLVLTTRLAHDGEWVECDFRVKVGKPPTSREGKSIVNEKQVIGIALTYARRYSLTSALMISTGEDSDGEDGTDRGHRPRGSASGERWSAACRHFSQKGIKPNQILSALNRRSVKDVTDQDHAYLERVWQFMESGSDFETAVAIAREDG